MAIAQRRDRTGRLGIGIMTLLFCLLALAMFVGFVEPSALAPDSILLCIARHVLLSLTLLIWIAKVSDHCVNAPPSRPPRNGGKGESLVGTTSVCPASFVWLPSVHALLASPAHSVRS